MLYGLTASLKISILSNQQRISFVKVSLFLFQHHSRLLSHQVNRVGNQPNVQQFSLVHNLPANLLLSRRTNRQCNQPANLCRIRLHSQQLNQLHNRHHDQRSSRPLNPLRNQQANLPTSHHQNQQGNHPLSQVQRQP